MLFFLCETSSQPSYRQRVVSRGVWASLDGVLTTPGVASSDRSTKGPSVGKTGFRPVVSVFSAFTPSRTGAVAQNVPVMAEMSRRCHPKDMLVNTSESRRSGGAVVYFPPDPTIATGGGNGSHNRHFRTAIGSAFFAARIAGTKGRDTALWFIAGLCCGLAGLIAALHADEGAGGDRPRSSTGETPSRGRRAEREARSGAGRTRSTAQGRLGPSSARLPGLAPRAAGPSVVGS